MTLKIRSISIGERDTLEPLLVANPEVIEDGLRVITHQQQTDTSIRACDTMIGADRT